MSFIELTLAIGFGLFVGNVLTTLLNDIHNYNRRKQMRKLMGEMTKELDKLIAKAPKEKAPSYIKTPVKKPKVTKKAVAKKGKK